MWENIKFLYNFIIKLCYKNRITASLLDFLFYLDKKIVVKKIDKNLLINVEWIQSYNIPIKRFYEKKLPWISWVARLKNANHFLEKCIESHIPFLDELVLVDNMSTDDTKKTCDFFKKKYPNKVKVYQYLYDVNPPSYSNSNIPSNSVHSLAYYYNRCFSKTNYSHVMKVDDDIILVKEKMKYIREYSLSKWKNRFNSFRWINLVKDNKWNICTLKWYEFAWKNWDIAIYPVSPFTYYVQWPEWEVFVNNLHIKRLWFWFLHLKLLKPNYWFHNIKDKKYSWNRINNYSGAEYWYDFDRLLKWESPIDLKGYFKEFE